MMGRWFLLILIASLISCKTDIPKEIVGYWEGETIKQDIKFSPGEQLEIIDHKYSTYTGTYRISDGNILTCEMDQQIFTEPIVKEVEIKGDTLILMEKKRKEVYHRRK